MQLILLLKPNVYDIFVLVLEDLLISKSIFMELDVDGIPCTFLAYII